MDLKAISVAEDLKKTNPGPMDCPMKLDGNGENARTS